MTVKKKVPSTSQDHDTMNLSRELTQVREAITQLSTDEGVVNMDAPATSTTESPSTVKKVVKKIAKKKTAPPTPVKLADLCKSLRMEPRVARRALRTKKVKNPGRWTWKKGSGELSRITNLLKAYKDGK